MRHRLLGLLLLLFLTATSMAVDRSKFRTCKQTSFCRRHRQHADATPHKSHVLYHYEVLPDSVHFHLPSEEQPPVDDESSKKKKTGGGVWQSLQRRLSGAAAPGEDDAHHEYVAGPLPTLTATLHNAAKTTEFDSTREYLKLSVTALSGGMARVRITEVYGQQDTAYEYPRVTYDNLVLETESLTAASHALWWNHHGPMPDWVPLNVPQQQNNADDDNYVALQFGDSDTSNNSVVVVLQLNPFQLSLYRQEKELVRLNGQDVMHFEIRRSKEEEAQQSAETAPDIVDEKNEELGEEKPEKEIVGYWEDGLAIYADGTREEKPQEEQPETEEEIKHRQLTEAALDTEGLWEESFSSHEDSKPFGPMSVGLDVSFPHSQHLYGIPEHASSAILQTTRGDDAHYKEPYRLYNLDVFEYELDETMALYGSIPFVVSQSTETGSVGVFWFNPSETFVDVAKEEDSVTSHWISESGVLDIFLLPGPDPSSLYRQYAQLTGTTPLPPMFSLGYHQCRWNYKDEKDVYYVHGKFEELDYPYDVLWLDIEHTDGKRYFTWDKALFPNPKEMQEKLAAQGRRMVTIVDPHIKRDNQYYIHKEATSKGLYIKDKDGKKDFDGWCWPGSSSYLDFTAEHVRSWWADQFHYNKYEGSTSSLFTWNDMNEPSVFNGPEVSMSKDLRNLKGEEHREWHNLYGMLFQRTTAEGLTRRNQPTENVRPFVLSRAFFAGSQRYGAIWTGDNTAEWGHLQVAAPMLLSMNAVALTFVGADVGGFFGNPDAELFTRWMQAGAYQPFFRGHAHHDSKRREPWTFDEDTMKRLRHSAMARYALLPYWYTIFRESELTGMPVMRMMWMEYPKTSELFDLDDQYLIGADMLVKPVITAGATSATVLFPTDDIWYDAESLKLVSSKIAPGAVKSMDVPADIDTIPVFQRGGSILPRKLRLRRSSMVMKHDPYTLYIALDVNKKAEGELYMDDEESFAYQRKFEHANATFTADFSDSKSSTLLSSVSIGSGWVDFVDSLATDRMVERIIVMGVAKSPKKIVCDGEEIDFNYNARSRLLVLRKPEVSAMAEWSISLQS